MFKYVIRCLGSETHSHSDEKRYVENLNENNGRLYTHIDEKFIQKFDSQKSAEILIAKIKAIHNIGLNKKFHLQFKIETWQS